jgi:hypothetical protein
MVPDEAIFSFQISTYHMKFQTIYDGAMLMVPVSRDEIRHVLYELREAENGLAIFDVFISAPPMQSILKLIDVSLWKQELQEKKIPNKKMMIRLKAPMNAYKKTKRI